MKRFRFLLILGLSLLAMSAAAAGNEKKEALPNPFVAVFIDSKTENTLGPFPYDRAKTAQAIRKFREAGAKAVIIKYFLDLPKPGTGDDELAEEIKQLPALFQARFDASEAHPNPLPERFNYAARVQGDTKTLLTGKSGWLPLEKFSRNSVGIGFVDVFREGISRVPLVVRYGSVVVPSLWLAALEQALGKPAQIVLGKEVTIGAWSLPVTASGEADFELPAADQIDSLSLIDVLQGKVAPGRLAGKVVILGWDTEKTPLFDTKLGKLRLHRIFYHALVGLFSALRAR